LCVLLAGESGELGLGFFEGIDDLHWNGCESGVSAKMHIECFSVYLNFRNQNGTTKEKKTMRIFEFHRKMITGSVPISELCKTLTTNGKMTHVLPL